MDVENIDGKNFNRILEGLDKGAMLTIAYKAAGATHYARFWLHPRESRSIHFHLLLAHRDFFGGNPPKTTHKRGELEGKLSLLEGLTVDIKTNAWWDIDKEQLPRERPFPWSTEVKTTVRGVGMELIGSQFRISGGEIDYLSWHWSDDKKSTLRLATRGISRHEEWTRTIALDSLVDAESYLRKAILGEVVEES